MSTVGQGTAQGRAAGPVPCCGYPPQDQEHPDAPAEQPGNQANQAVKAAAQ